MGSTLGIDVEKMVPTPKLKENGVMLRPEGEVGFVMAQNGSSRSGVPTSNILIDETIATTLVVKEPPMVIEIMDYNNIVV